MKYLLIKSSSDYADEFDCNSFAVFSEEYFEKTKKLAEKYFANTDNEERYFGTNEWLSWPDYNSWLEQLEITEITELEAKTLNVMFNYQFKPTANVINNFYWGTGSRAIFNFDEN